MNNKQLSIKSSHGNNHIVNILGSIDDKIENNEKKLIKIKELTQLIFKDFQNNISHVNPNYLGEFITFTKGKKPSDANTKLRNYLTIEGMTTNKYNVVCSDGMILAQENDVLMVMDGASSGTIYSGFNGIVGSTLAKLTSNNNELIPLIEQKLIQMQNKIKELNTGSAIPHVSKEFVQSIKILLSNDQYQTIIINKLKLLKLKVSSLRNANIALNNLKQLYLKKFFG